MHFPEFVVVAYCNFKGGSEFLVAFLGINQFRRVGLRFVYWFYDGNTQRLTESGFTEKPAIEPATPGVQDIGLSPTQRRLQANARHPLPPHILFLNIL